MAVRPLEFEAGINGDTTPAPQRLEIPQNPPRRETLESILRAIPRPLRPTYHGIPFHHRKTTLNQIQREEGITFSENFWHIRGNTVEKRGAKIIKSEPKVENVFINEHNSPDDHLGHDITIVLKNSPVRIMWGQMKPDRAGVVDFKQDLRDRYFSNKRNSARLVQRLITGRGIILLNAGETKSRQEIIESYRPQKRRIMQRVRREQLKTEPRQYQIWPYVPEANFTQPFQ